jgi:peptidyl-prolyl cis-trans isomerase SurA
MGLRRSLFACFAAFGIALAAEDAQASIVERVVAVVGERPILLSDLKLRARPHLVRIMLSTNNDAQRAAAESELYKELLNKMIEERLEEQAADKAHITVTPEEVDNGIRQVSAQTKLSPRELVAEARKQGLTEQDYRDEIRRQVLEGKLIQLRVRGRVRVTEQDARAAYAHWEKENASQSPVDLRILVLQVPPNTTPEKLQAMMTLGQDLTNRARKGEDFCDLVLNYSQDPTTKSTCGSRGAVPRSMLYPELQSIADTVKVGGTADPVTFKDPLGNQAVLVVQVAQKQASLPAYDQVKDQMMERAFIEATERQRKLWLQELRRGVYIDVRL